MEAAAFGDAPAELKYYWSMEYDWDGSPLIISRTGWSSELGYEIFLRNGSAGDKLWEHLMAVGGPLGLKPGHTSSIRRIEAGMLSYHADMTLANNPYELRMDRLVDLDAGHEFVSKPASIKIREQAVSQYFVGLEVNGDPMERSNDEHWPIISDDQKVGHVTSAIYSPRLGKNIALAMVASGDSSLGNHLSIEMAQGSRACTVVPIPFYDPKKEIARRADRRSRKQTVIHPFGIWLSGVRKLPNVPTLRQPIGSTATATNNKQVTDQDYTDAHNLHSRPLEALKHPGKHE